MASPLPLLQNPSVLAYDGIVVGLLNAPMGQSAQWGIDQAEQTWQGSRVYTNTLRVITSHAFVGPIAIIDFLVGINITIGSKYIFPIPEYGANANGASFFPSEQDTGSFIQSINLEQDAEDGRQWLCRLEYGPFDIVHELGDTNITYGSFTPLDFPPVVRWSTAKYQRSYVTDITGNPFINTAGDPLENPPQREESTQCLTVIEWTSEYSDSFYQSYRDTINSDQFYAYAPGQVKCKDIDGERVYTADYGYVWRIKFEFEVRIVTITTTVDGEPTTEIYGWEDLVLNAGFRAFGGANGTSGQPLLPIIIGGQPVSNPMILNQDGTCTIQNSTGVQNLEGNSSIYLVFYNYPYTVFADLGLPDDLLTTNQ